MTEKRDWDDPQYKEWRQKIYRRDKYSCRMPSCGRKGFKNRIQAHHIKRWADFPELRFDPNNGITLCRRCHDMISKMEQAYESLFLDILSNSKSVNKKKDYFQDVKTLLYSPDYEDD